jgi:hypothetical protein
MFTRLATVILVFTIAIPSAALSQPITIESLQKRCSEKTLVYGRDAKGGMIKTGETLDGYCVGYLEGALAAMQHAQLICPDFSKGQIDAGFLLSVIDTYVKDAGLSQIDAGQAIDEAYRRAFPCKQ